MLLDPDNLTMRYNFACGFVELNDAETALNLLDTVFQKDTLETVNWAKVDPDLDALRDHPRFKAMLEGADKRLATTGG
jgi:adenylate cyclase